MRRRLVLAAACVAVAIGAAAAAVSWFATSASLRQALERETADWIGEPVRIGRVSAVFLPRVSLALHDVRIGEPPRTTLALVTLSLPVGALFSRRIEDADITVADSRLEMPLPFPVAARAGTASGGEGRGLELVSIRSIALRGVTVVGASRDVHVFADSSLQGRRLTVSNLTAISNATRIEAKGTIDLSPRVDAALSATAERLDVDDLLALAAAFGASPADDAQAAGETARMTVDVVAPEGTLGGVEIGRFEARLVSDDGQLVVEPLAFDVLGGRFTGSVDAGLGGALAMNLRGRVSNLDVAQLAEFGESPGTITGRLYGSGRLSAQGVDLGSALATARGVGEVVISDGTIQRLRVIRTALAFIGRPEASEPAAAGERFDEISAGFSLANRRIRTDDLRLRATDVDILGSGTLDLETKGLSGRADLVLSESLSAQAGRDLFRYTRAGNRIVLPATVGGMLGSPTVGIDAAAAVGRGIRNEIERRLEDVFELVRP